MPLDEKIIKKYLKTDIPVRVFSVTGSTNSEAAADAARVKGGFALYAADSQTSGRGRRGHSFFSPAGGLYMTLSCPVEGPVGSMQCLTCAAAVAVCGAVRALSSHVPTVKWVNDVYVDGRKAAGILCELVTDDNNSPLAVIIGVGINLAAADFPAEFADRAVSLGDIDPSRLCAEIVNRLMELYLNITDNSFIEEYKRLNFVLGRRVRYADISGDHTAEAVDIADDGSLIVSENGVDKRLSSGEISVIPV